MVRHMLDAICLLNDHIGTFYYFVLPYWYLIISTPQDKIALHRIVRWCIGGQIYIHIYIYVYRLYNSDLFWNHKW